MYSGNRFVHVLDRTVPPSSGGGVVFLPFNIAFGAGQKSRNRMQAAGAIRISVDSWIVFEILTVPGGGSVDFVDGLADMARRLVQIVPNVAELGPLHQAFRAPQVGASVQVGRMPPRRVAESGGNRYQKCNGESRKNNPFLCHFSIILTNRK